MSSDTDQRYFLQHYIGLLYCRMAVRGSSVRMPSGHMMSRGQALLAGLSVCSWLHSPSKHDSYSIVRVVRTLT